MNKNHLYWIIPLLLIIGYLLGLYLNIPQHINIIIDYSDRVAEMMYYFNQSVMK